jgi:hypothetical protein
MCRRPVGGEGIRETGDSGFFVHRRHVGRVGDVGDVGGRVQGVTMNHETRFGAAGRGPLANMKFSSHFMVSQASCARRPRGSLARQAGTSQPRNVAARPHHFLTFELVMLEVDNEEEAEPQATNPERRPPTSRRAQSLNGGKSGAERAYTGDWSDWGPSDEKPTVEGNASMVWKRFCQTRTRPYEVSKADRLGGQKVDQRREYERRCIFCETMICDQAASAISHIIDTCNAIGALDRERLVNEIPSPFFNKCLGKRGKKLLASVASEEDSEQQTSGESG